MSEIQAANRIARILDLDSDDISEAIEGGRFLQKLCHDLSRNSGWWKEYDECPDQYKKYMINTKILLSITELCEGVEGYRKNLNDDHLPDRKMLEVELADAIIRIGDFAEELKLNVFGALIEKLAYNQQRADHKPEARAADGGKSF